MKKTATLSLTWVVLCGLLAPVAAAVPGSADDGERVRQGPGIGLILEVGDPSGRAVGADRPFFVRLTVEWARVEHQRGVYDWSFLEPVIRDLTVTGKQPVLCLTGSNPLYLDNDAPPSPLAGDSIAGWIAFVRSAAREFASSVGVFEIWDRPDRADAPFDPESYGFLLKSSALAIRAEAQALGVEVAISQGSVALEHLDWQRRVWDADTAPYV
ncbi:MAG: hypothetical protein R3344_15150, partial [Acidobacteriota bacterium]|nr:hypothetical protein [Acidobacteriota bacterium]